MIRVRKEWQLTKAEFDALPYTEQLEMMAEMAVTSEMAAYDAYIIEKRAKHKQGK